MTHVTPQKPPDRNNKVTSRIPLHIGYSRKTSRNMWSLAVFSCCCSLCLDSSRYRAVNPCNITVMSVLIMVVQRRMWRQMELVWVDDLMQLLTDSPVHGI